MPQESSQPRICGRPLIGHEVNGSQAKATTPIWTQSRPRVTAAISSAAVPLPAASGGWLRGRRHAAPRRASRCEGSSGPGPPASRAAARRAGSGSAARSPPAPDSRPGAVPCRAGQGLRRRPGRHGPRVGAERLPDDAGSAAVQRAAIRWYPGGACSRHPCVTHCAPSVTVPCVRLPRLSCYLPTSARDLSPPPMRRRFGPWPNRGCGITRSWVGGTGWPRLARLGRYVLRHGG